MLDIRLIREQPDFVKSRLSMRGGDDGAKIDEVLRVDAERRKAETALQQLNGDRKRLSKEIGGKRAKGEGTEEIEARVCGYFRATPQPRLVQQLATEKPVKHAKKAGAATPRPAQRPSQADQTQQVA